MGKQKQRLYGAKMIQQGNILFYRPSSLLGRIVSWATGDYSHVSIALDDEDEIEAAIEGAGVNIGRINYRRHFDVVKVKYDPDALTEAYDVYSNMRYGVLQAITLGLRMKFGLRVYTKHGVICSEFVAFYLIKNKYINIKIDNVNTITPTTLYRKLQHAEV